MISGIKYCKQNDPRHCGPTVASMVLSKLGLDITQEQIAQAIMKINSRGSRIALTIDVCRYILDFGIHTICYSQFPDEKAWELLNQCVQKQIPVIVSQQYSTKINVGHYRIVLDIETVGKKETEIVIYHDPLRGAYQSMRKDTFMELWKPGNSPDMVVKNEMIIFQKSKQVIPKTCLCCEETVLTYDKNFDQWLDYQFINSNTKFNAKAIAYQCDNCGSRAAYYEQKFSG